MQTRLNMKQKILVAGTLFGMFFGAGNLIFPVHLGQIAGRNMIPATIGFVITAVGIPILGVAAIGNTHSDGLQTLSSKVSKGYGYFFTCLLYLTIGPFFAIPRCATTSFTTGIEPMLGNTVSVSLALFLFSLLFFALVLFFSLRPAGITTWIGKIINPLFLIFLAILVIAALINPGASAASVDPAEAYESKALFSGFIEGYGTMDAIAGLAFGIIVIDIIRAMGVNNDSDVAKDVLSSGIMTGILMAIIYVATILMGTQSRGLFETSENGGIALAQISNHYLGTAGSLVLALTITLACLKTSIGLVTSCADTFARMFPKSCSYKTWAILFTVFSFAISNFGLSNIINYSIPVLMFLYPLAITLIALALCGKLFDHDQRVYVSVTIFTGVAALFDLAKTLPAELQSGLHLEGIISSARTVLPWFDLNLGWVVPALIGLALGLLIRKTKQASKNNTQKPAITTVIFDIGRVLNGFDWKDYLGRIVQDPAAYKAVEKAVFLNPAWVEHDKGLLSLKEELDEFILAAPAYEQEIRAVYENLGEVTWEYDYTIPWVKELKEKGYKVYALSNWPEHLYDQRGHKLDFLDLMDGYCLSFQEHLNKPDPAAFQNLLDKYQIVPGEAVFIDDTAKNIEAAEKLGIHGILFTGYEETKDQLKKLGVL